MKQLHEIIRQDFLKTVTSDKVRLIISSQFTVTPLFEDIYQNFLKTNQKYFEIYKRWVLSQNPLLLPNDENDLYQLRQGALGLPDIILPGIKIKINEPLLFLLLDILNPFLDNIIAHACTYYRITGDYKKISTTKIMTLMESLTPWDKESVDREGYPNFAIAVAEAFKALFTKNMEVSTVKFSEDDTEFKVAFENEWQRIAIHTDFLNGFEVMPTFTPEDTFRYLRLPFTNKKFRSLSKQKNYQEVINYVAAIATFKPMPDGRIRTYYRQELCKLFTPLITARIKKTAREKLFLLDKQVLQKALEEDLTKTAGQFEFFYATRKNLQNKHQAPPGSLIFPLRNQLVKLGTVSADDQYPFTAYITRQFEKKIRVYFANDLKNDDAIFSLDEIFENDFEECGSVADLISNESQCMTDHIPDYDAKDATGNILGWKIKTFAGITGKSADTLRRWEKQELIQPIRYKIYSPFQRKKICYRAYTKDHIEQAKKISETMAKKKRHQA
jgi:hypothetical protein